MFPGGQKHGLRVSGEAQSIILADLCGSPLPGLLQVVVDGADLLRHSEGALPACEELAVFCWYKK